MKRCLVLISSAILFSYSCNKKIGSSPNLPPRTDTFFAKGADVSWVTQMESEGINFYNKAGAKEDLFKILKDGGMNSIRLRVWVNPADGWCNTDDLVAKALRAKESGMKILIDFHYSDWWADPGKQNNPAAWLNQDINQLNTSLKNYTLNVLNVLKTYNISPDWVQIGNETNDGMLWPEGQASKNMSNFASLINSGYSAVKSVFPNAKVIVHISNGFDNSLFRWIFDGLKNNGAQWDIIGMSLYPTASNWQQLNDQCLSNMNDMINRYGKEVMICEVGMPVSDSLECRNFISDLVQKSKSIKDHKSLGVFYWEPECFANWSGYSLGAFNNNGQPTIALDAFK